MNQLKFITLVNLLPLALLLAEIKAERNSTGTKIENLNQNSTENGKSETVLSKDELVLEKWRKMEKLFKTFSSQAVKAALPSILRFSGDIDISSKCSGSIMKTISGFKAMKSWAFKILDASGKIPNGVLGGYLSSLGDFDGCLSVEVPGSQPFRGQYCTVFITLPLPEWKPFHSADDILPVLVNFTKEGMVLNDLVKVAHHSFYAPIRTSICVPSTCSLNDIRSLIDSASVALELPMNVSVSTCDVTEPLVFSKSDIAIICVLSVFLLLAFVATITDVILIMISKEKRVNMESSSTAVKCLMCFSTYTNTLRLLKKDDSPHSIKIFHGFKFITLLWVILNHTYLYSNLTLLGALYNAREFGKEIAFQVVANGFLNVETFFFISAVLVAYGRMKFVGKHLNIPLYIFRRVWRLSPPLMLIIATSMLVPHMGSGPAWKETIVPMVDRCKANWWANLVFVNNFLSHDDMCYEWLWYIPVDTHMYILALLVIVPLKSRPKLAHGINITMFIAATIATAAAHVYYRLHPIPLFFYSHPKDRNYFSENSYFRTYTHITTCCIGLYVGYILATRPKLKIPKILNICGWLSSLSLGLLVVYGVYDWNQGSIPGLFLSTIYTCTAKVVWALALSYITIACYTGNGGVVSSILGWQALVPFSRLTYMAYIVHPILHYMRAGSARITVNADHKEAVYSFLTNIIIAYGFAYVISLLFESPFMCLEKVMFSKKLTAKTSERLKIDENGSLGNQFKCVESAVSTINMKKIEDTEPVENRFVHKN